MIAGRCKDAIFTRQDHATTSVPQLWRVNWHFRLVSKKFRASAGL
jgi:hypothetical protein